VNKRIDQLLSKIPPVLGLDIRISAGIFLFILFFQPFPLPDFTINNHIIFVAGIGGIILVSMIIGNSFKLWINEDSNINGNDSRQVLLSYAGSILMFLISATATVFYLRYAGSVRINFFIAFRVVLICLAPPVILNVYSSLSELKSQISSLVTERKIVQQKIEKYEEDYLNQSVEFRSENTNENFVLHIAEVAFIKSADNYVEIVYKEGVTFKKKLIRNTLKNVEQQIKQYSNFLRSHRICIVNVHFIENLKLINNSYWLTIKGYNEMLPVSRQYLLKLREAI
jgi:DNA-binding LytR/AlgR family response regulator